MSLRTDPPPEIPILIPSRGRVGIATTQKNYANSKFVVSESEGPAYREAYPDVEVITHPDDVLGYSPKWQWMIENIKTFFSMDDDLGPLQYLGDAAGEGTRQYSAKEAWDIVQHVGGMAWQVGAYLWSFAATSDPRNYKPQTPFRTSGGVSLLGNIGIFEGSKLYTPDDPYCLVSDYFLSALNAYHHRYLWVDQRFGVTQTQRTFAGQGGASEWRNMHHLERWQKEMKRYFGDAIQDKIKNRETRGQRSHRYEINFVCPW